MSLHTWSMLRVLCSVENRGTCREAWGSGRLNCAHEAVRRHAPSFLLSAVSKEIRHFKTQEHKS